ncbi:Uncharacterized protein PPKH_1497 [Pseudomonas putida]|nr:Uncharacterized protein PPKH_1497 [Pseudomonas putida]
MSRIKAFCQYQLSEMSTGLKSFTCARSTYRQAFAVKNL